MAFGVSLADKRKRRNLYPSRAVCHINHLFLFFLTYEANVIDIKGPGKAITLSAVSDEMMEKWWPVLNEVIDKRIRDTQPNTDGKRQFFKPKLTFKIYLTWVQQRSCYPEEAK